VRGARKLSFISMEIGCQHDGLIARIAAVEKARLQSISYPQQVLPSLIIVLKSKALRDGEGGARVSSLRRDYSSSGVFSLVPFASPVLVSRVFQFASKKSACVFAVNSSPDSDSTMLA
jgi:hypothetical protein